MLTYFNLWIKQEQTQEHIIQEKLFSLLPTFCATYFPSSWNLLLLFRAVCDLELAEAEEQQQRLSWARKRQTAQGFLSAPNCLSFISSSQLCSEGSASPPLWGFCSCCQQRDPSPCLWNVKAMLRFKLGARIAEIREGLSFLDARGENLSLLTMA